MNTHARTLIRTLAAAVLAAAPAAASPDRDLDSRESYSYVRVLEGRATLASEGAGPGEDAEINQPLLVGDRIAVARGARVEVALADRNLLRVGGDTSVTLSRIAFSGDRGDRDTRLDLEEGEIVLVVTDEALGDRLPEIRTPGAEIIVHRPGVYRVETDRSGWTELVVRDGFAELVTSAGSSIVRAGESAITFGDRWSGVDLASAGAENGLERWGAELDRRAASGAVLHVEPELAYDAAPLVDYGTWVSYGSTWYWRPRVAVDWRPYWQGRWAWTPSGLTWVSSEPWGWVPYHYGTWCQLPGYGWAWRPGRLYSPAWVYWHWSDAWVGWCPVGYYTSWYGPGYYGSGFRFGVYGWASGDWGFYSHWNFGPTWCLRGRHQRRHWRHGGDLGRELGPRVPRGVVTTDTRGLPRRTFADRGVGSRELMHRVERRLERDPLVDVTDFVARRKQLSPEVVAAVRSTDGARIRLADVPRAEAENRARRPDWDRRGERQDVVRGDRGGPATESPGEVARKARPGAVEERTVRGGDVGRAAPRTEIERGRPSVTDERDRPRAKASDAGVLPPRDDAGTAPADRQGWRQRTEPQTRSPRSVEPPSRRPPDQRLKPGEAAEIDSGGRVRRLPPGDSGRVSPGSRGSSQGARSSTAAPPVTEGRQGWKGQDGWSAPRTAPPSRSAPSAPSTRSSEPVQRVFGGVRRYESSQPRTLPPNSTYRRPESDRTVRPPSGSTAAPRSSPRATAPPSSRRTASPPPSRPPSSSSSTRPSSGSSRSPRASDSGSKSSSRRDAPPPRRKHD